MLAMPTPLESTKSSLSQRLRSHAAVHWPQLTVQVRFRGAFAYVDGHVGDDEPFPLCRLRYGGSASIWGFALYLYSSGKYEDQVLPTGGFVGASSAARKKPSTAPAASTSADPPTDPPAVLSGVSIRPAITPHELPVSTT
jgi:hypothetical protein